MIGDVPTALDLVEMSRKSDVTYANVVQRNTKGEPSIIRITPEGHRLLGQRLKQASERFGHPDAEELRKQLRAAKASTQEGKKK